LKSEVVWGWNPATLEAYATAAAALFAFLAAVIALITWRQSRREISSRMRPWVGLYGFEFQRDLEGRPKLFVLLRNIGTLPAQNAHLLVVVKPCKQNDGEQPNPARSEKFDEKALVPTEDGNFGVSLSTYPQVDTWISEQRDLAIEGTFTYALDGRAFESKFQAELWFSRPKPEKGLVQTNWRNVSAS
jgi:hypothetical protein